VHHQKQKAKGKVLLLQPAWRANTHRTEQMSEQIPEGIIPYGTEVSRFWVWKENTGRRHDSCHSRQQAAGSMKQLCFSDLYDPTREKERERRQKTHAAVALGGTHAQVCRRLGIALRLVSLYVCFTASSQLWKRLRSNKCTC
jgi:hypothetical protein